MTDGTRVASPPSNIRAMLEGVREHSDLEADPEFVGGYLKAAFVEGVCQVMAERNMKNSDLAKILGKSDQYVGRVLKEQTNFTLESVAEFACALGMRVTVTLHRSDERVAVLPAVEQPPNSIPLTQYTASNATIRRQGGGHGEHFAA